MHLPRLVINRQLLANSQIQPRILSLQLCSDRASSYNSVMNSIFSADKVGVPIDAMVLSKEDSHFMQQACFLTKGIYQKPADQRDMLQLLFTHGLPSNTTRALLNVPQPKTVDFRASCFCHKMPVEFAYMCSVCLALTCQASPVCETCGTDAR